jgi:hypothetical protein
VATKIIAPSAPEPTPENLVEVVRTLKNNIDLREGRTKVKNQRHVTIQDLIDAGVVVDGKIK